LLYEPSRGTSDVAFVKRHQLDGAMDGFVFPELSIFSAGSEALYVSRSRSQPPFSDVDFLVRPAEAPSAVDRSLTEDALVEIVQTTLRRLPAHGPAYHDLSRAWERVCQSIEHQDELGYCRAAGRLGIDPYDPDGPDLTRFGEQLEAGLFEDVTDAAIIEELDETTAWARDMEGRLREMPQIDLGVFGACPPDDLSRSAGLVGADAAGLVRTRNGWDIREPRRSLELALGDILPADRAMAQSGPWSLRALVLRTGDTARVGTVAGTAREQRFRACTAAYIAWTSQADESRAATPAITRRQQAGRAFAAELLAPREYLRGLALERPAGLTSDDIERIAGDLICPSEAVTWQAWRARIPLRGSTLVTGRQVTFG
jgi:hypothetical protein